MITAAQAKEIAIKRFTAEEIEAGIKMMAEGNKLSWAKLGRISEELKAELEANGYEVNYSQSNPNLLIIDWIK